jgi:23S rRNA (uracil1939-C5)-methyltransferase
VSGDPRQDRLSLERLALGGDAVGRMEGGRVLFVPYGAAGDTIRLAAPEEQKGVLRARITALEIAGPDRDDPRCPLFFRPESPPEKVCGGCSWQHLSYPAQARAKQQLLIETFQRLGKIMKPPVEDIIPCPDPWRYRNKVQIPFAQMPDRKIVAGFYAPASHRVVPFEDCFIQTEDQVKIVRETLAWLNVNPLPVFDGKTGRGWLRHLYLRTNVIGEAFVALIVKDSAFPRGRLFAEQLMSRCPSVKSVFLNVNPRPGNVVLGPEWHRLAGRPQLDDALLGLRFRLSPGAFFQVNHFMAEKLYGKAVEFADPSPEDHVLELYAGVGAMGMLLAPKARYIWAVEENPQAVQDGIQSAMLNGITNIRFSVGRCEEVMGRRRPRRDLEGAPVIALLDPPRAGCSPSVLKDVMALKPRRIVYVSCDPATLARDARYLSTGGYLLRRSVPVDLFPQTAHIESVNLFSK